MNPRLAALLDSGQFDWENDKHREAYLRAWVNGAAPKPVRDPQGTRPGSGTDSASPQTS